MYYFKEKSLQMKNMIYKVDMLCLIIILDEGQPYKKANPS